MFRKEIIWLSIIVAWASSISNLSTKPIADKTLTSVKSKETTCGRIFVHNLSATSSTLGNPVLRQNWVSALKAKYQLVQIKNSHELALDCLEEVERQIQQAPSAALYKMRSQLCLYLHRFVEAEQSLLECKNLGEQYTSTLELEIAFIKNNEDELLDRLKRNLKNNPSMLNLCNLAVFESRFGNRDSALVHFRRAIALYEDPDPFPLAWLLVQIGNIHLNAGKFELSIEYFEEAERRLPAYAMAKLKLQAARASLTHGGFSKQKREIENDK